MSRDPFPDNPRDTADAPRQRSVPQRTSTPGNTSDLQNRAAESPGGSEAIDDREQHPGNDERSDSLRACYVRDRAYLLRDSELHSLKEVGKFRMIAVPDLQKHAYQGDRKRVEQDIRRLNRLHLLRDQTLPISQKKTLRVLTLTKAGYRLLKQANQLPDDQPIYHGLRKPREAKHDADLYRLYQKERARIERSGGKPLRVLLDYELKKNLNRDLAFLGAERTNRDRKKEIAAKHGFRLVNGKIPVPDMRVEYETAEFEVRHVDLELATREYCPRALAEKAAAGFSLYSRSEDASRLRRILDEREITAGILTL